MGRRSYGTGTLFVRRDRRGREVWYGQWRSGGRLVKRRIGLKRRPSTNEGLTKADAERELRKLIASVTVTPVVIDELELVRMVADLERDPARLGDTRVLTERECRQAERVGDRRWSVDVIADGRRQRRWPDLVLDFGDRRRAVELELAVKHTRRLEQIVEAYQRDRTFDEVLWLVEVPTLLARLETMIERNRSAPPAPRRLLQPVPMRVVGHFPRA